MDQTQTNDKIPDLFQKNVDMLTFDYFEDLNIKPSACLRLNQIVGESYGYLNGLSIDDLAPSNKIFMLANVVLEIGEKQKFESSITGQSWANGIDNRLLVRSAKFTNSSGQYLFGCTNYFLLVDTQNRKALWPSEVSLKKRGNNAEFSVKDPSYLFEIEAPLKEVEKRQIRTSHIDALGHINNSVYADFGTDNFTDEDLARGIRRMVIRFFKEIKNNQIISIFKGYEGKNIYFVGINQKGDTSFQILFEMNK